MTSTQSTLTQFSFVVLIVAGALGLMIALMGAADALFSDSEIDLDVTIPLAVLAMWLGFSAWLLRRI